MVSKFTEGAACKGKQRFESYRQGIESLRPASARRRTATGRTRFIASSNSFSRRSLAVYRCAYCGKFHVGHGHPLRPVDKGAAGGKRGYELPNPPA